jgi:hypothetical protein
MGVLSVQLAGVLQATVTQAPVEQANASTTSVNANQAQAAPVPEDTVTLSGQAGQGQQTPQNSQGQPFQGVIVFAAEAQVQGFASGRGAGAARTDAQQPPEAPATAQVQTQTQPQDPAAAALSDGPNASNGNAAGAPQGSEQELQQLDQTLQQLGINPQSVSLFNRLALLLYANDPAALQQFVQQLQEGAQEVGEGSGASPTGNRAQPHAQTLTSAPNHLASPGASGLPPESNSSTSGPGQYQSSDQASEPNSSFDQFAALQLTFGSTNQLTQPFLTSNESSSNSNQSSTGPSLNVTV